MSSSQATVGLWRESLQQPRRDAVLYLLPGLGSRARRHPSAPEVARYLTQGLRHWEPESARNALRIAAFILEPLFDIGSVRPTSCLPYGHRDEGVFEKMTNFLLVDPQGKAVPDPWRNPRAHALLGWFIAARSRSYEAQWWSSDIVQHAFLQWVRNAALLIVTVEDVLLRLPEPVPAGERPASDQQEAQVIEHPSRAQLLALRELMPTPPRKGPPPG